MTFITPSHCSFRLIPIERLSVNPASERVLEGPIDASHFNNSAYIQLTRRGESARKGGFDRTYTFDGRPCDLKFIELCDINFGMSPKGARLHYEVLRKHSRDGATFHRRCQEDSLNKSGYDDPTKYYRVNEAFDLDGVAMPGYVTVFKIKTPIT